MARIVSIHQQALCLLCAALLWACAGPASAAHVASLATKRQGAVLRQGDTTHERLSSRHGAKCLNVVGGSMPDAALPEQRACGPQASLRWPRE